MPQANDTSSHIHTATPVVMSTERAIDRDQSKNHPASLSGRFKLCALATLIGSLSAPGLALANTSTIEEMIVIAEQLDTYDVLPDRGSDSMFGTDKKMDETPRSITLIESDLVDLLGIRTVNDFVSITPGSFTGNYFGVAGALDIRGERADNFFRGFRRIENRGNFPTSVAATDYVEILKGPPPSIYGGGKVGGILNFIPKSAKNKNAKTLEESTGLVTATGGNYGKALASIEYGTPFEIGGMDSGAYVFIQHEDSDHYYDDIYNKNTLFQAALNTDINESWTIEYGAMYQDADLNQSLGWNRVTQELIDSEGGRYLAGTAALDLETNGDNQLTPAEIDIYDLEQFAFANPFPYDALTPEQKAAFALDPSTVGYTSIDHHTVQAETIDFSQSKVMTGYFDVVYSGGDDANWSIKNQTFYDDMDHTKYSSYGFTADYDAYVFENKTTYSGSFEPSGTLGLDVVGGFSYRKSKGLEQESRGRGYQVLDRRDISLGATDNDRFLGAYTGDGLVPYNWVQDGESTNIGAFALVDVSLNEKLNVILSGRIDDYDVETFGTDVAGNYASAEDQDTATSYNISLNYAVLPSLNLYATYAESDYVELGQGGIIARTTIEDGTWIQESELTEVGLKGWLFDRKLYFSGTAYTQEKTAFNNLSGTFNTYESEGFELEMRWAATETLSVTGAATWQETTVDSPPFFLGVPPEFLGLDPALTYGGRFVATGGALGISGPLDSPNPDTVFSLNGIYTSPYGWGISLGATHVDAIYAGYTESVRLPSYTVAKGAVFYNPSSNLSIRLNMNNLFDEKYYTPQFLFWDVFVSPSVGQTAELTATYSW